MDLSTPIKDAGRLFKIYSRRLEKLGIIRLSDLLLHIPFRYEDYSLVSKIGKLRAGDVATIKGEVDSIKNVYTKGYRRIQKARVKDNTGEVEIVWFNQPFILKTIKKGERISISGKVDQDGGKLVFRSPDYELESENLIHTGRLVPIYPETKGVSSKWIRRQVFKLLEGNVEKDPLPDKIRNENGLMEYAKAIRNVHFPDTPDEALKARNRLAFDELLTIHLGSIIKRGEWDKIGKSRPFKLDKAKLSEFEKSLPFKLTDSQQKAISEILNDLGLERPMNRLLEGDVGSGKTVVSCVAMYIAYLNGFQSVFMAPTEILTLQHFKTISDLLSPFGLSVALRTGSLKTGEKDSDITVGTHALIQKHVDFENLGLVIIDEQQRFGVEQRGILRKKGKTPHFLTMTATPIPRTVALTLYGDLDLSVLTDMPKGRKIIKTWVVPSAKRESAYAWIEKELKKTSSQAFVICPFIEESESAVTVKAAVKEFENLKTRVFTNLKLGLLHGKMKSAEKEKALGDFRRGKADILVATPVVEVGIDIPNATIMVLEASERFGLSQLHQLRGRVGRGDKQSYCLLFTESLSQQTIQRLRSMEKTQVGSELAEIDLKLRGAGEVYGTAQHGVRDLKIANFSDLDLLKKSFEAAKKIFPDIKKYPMLLEKVNNVSTKNVSPD
ncbi:MAG: ATP-dependent DNA helicase RecG [Candidatus Levybacteria bacterium RIFOXYA1_FULL_41_10]|nr:MAG: ATP-dependent DNA helicase [Candidatus Levybacteria bacterium GW2011_GWC2_40_7]KKR94977.1 MAG: ATP-dependent DNA helicase [Candidatus Levybacteria bacterium GW2011_GWA2_41_15]OGH27674.1 MAG: ATP-dependent DNA helicase RecG [Candidatus Levybacteria bacterium RIFCSPHIGHO2_02_FULL_40_29]OGH32790.1 MAG: ATP-dependent DNA helicase RecG [Candidatus Levybacteria bacterium RIFCSPHIGHO2_12_FULL_40_44]OGH50007.1 MAG: ATP-dependent DNA helicase RecG [Candidatus Levybacteria bacterium RIFCSPLOWO2_0